MPIEPIQRDFVNNMKEWDGYDLSKIDRALSYHRGNSFNLFGMLFIILGIGVIVASLLMFKYHVISYYLSLTGDVAGLIIMIGGVLISRRRSSRF